MPARRDPNDNRTETAVVDHSEIARKLRKYDAFLGRRRDKPGLVFNGDWTDETCALLGQVKDVELVEVTGIQASSQALADLSGLRKVRELHFEKNPDEVISTESLDGFSFLAGWRRLEDVYLGFLGKQEDHIGDALAAHVLGFPHLREVYIQGLTEAGLAHLGQCPALEQMWLGLNPIEKGFLPLRNCRFLKEMDLDGCPLQAEAFDELAQLDQLVSLHLMQTALDDGGLARLAQMASLEVLTICSTKVTSRGLAGLGEYPKLRRVLLDVQLIESEGIRGLRTCRNLHELWIQGDTFDRRLERELRRALPRCKLTLYIKDR